MQVGLALRAHPVKNYITNSTYLSNALSTQRSTQSLQLWLSHCVPVQMSISSMNTDHVQGAYASFASVMHVLFVQQQVVLQLYSRYHREAAIHSKLIIPVLSYDWGVTESHSLRGLHISESRRFTLWFFLFCLGQVARDASYRRGIWPQATDP